MKNKYIIAFAGLCGLILLLTFLLIRYQAPATVPPAQRITPAISAGPDQTMEEIILDVPVEGEGISSPLQITGRARGNWFFEANFPVVLTDRDGKIIAESYATAQGEWMTEEFVPFTATLDFAKPADGERGNLILQKANPSGLPENDEALELTVFFK